MGKLTVKMQRILPEAPLLPEALNFHALDVLGSGCMVHDEVASNCFVGIRLGFENDAAIQGGNLDGVIRRLRH